MKPPSRHRNVTVKRLLLDAFQLIRCQSWACRIFGKPFHPSRKYIEIDITYKCNLKCFNCNRSCAQAPSEMEMPLSTVDSFIAQSVEQQVPWKRIRILGGEPTLHSRFSDIVDRLIYYQRRYNPSVRLVVGTNYHGRSVRRALDPLPPSVAIKSTLKTSRNNLFRPFNVVPGDSFLNRFSDVTCGCRIIAECGLGLTPTGYYMCAVAGGIDRIFGFRLGRPNLPAPSDGLLDQMAAFCPLCGHFGFQWPTRKIQQSRIWRQAYARAAQQTKQPE